MAIFHPVPEWTARLRGIEAKDCHHPKLSTSKMRQEERLTVFLQKCVLFSPIKSDAEDYQSMLAQKGQSIS